MSYDIIQRHLSLDDFTIERTNDGGRTLLARALTYGVPYEVTDDGGHSWYHEVWRAGVFAKSIVQRAGRIPMLTLHDRRRLPVGVTTGIEPDESAFIFRAKFSRTRDADEALELVNDGVLNAVSVGARPLNNRAIKGGVERVEAVLQEISLAPPTLAQMSDGVVLAVRAIVDPAPDGELQYLTLDEARALENLPVTPALDEARQYLSTLQRP